MTPFKFRLADTLILLPGEGEGGNNPPPAEEKNPTANPEPSADEKKFSQADLDHHIRERFKKHAQELEAARGESKGKDQELTKLNEMLENLRRESMTKEELAKEKVEGELKTLKANLETTTKERDEWSSRYQQMMINNALIEAATHHEAVNPVKLARFYYGDAKLVPVTDNDGKPTGELVVKMKVTVKGKELELSPRDAMQKLKEDPDNFNDYKSTLKGGLGFGGNPNGFNGAGEMADDPEAYRKQRDARLGRK